ncbi:hypothetical protein A2Y99_04985 [Candidatus Gottesmanbacteria bacterium RBG_13_37_7]|uniref:Uncharacterized protein n=1 Tax=Candidatus Gottesmanbacteria bacterium RBG_13_37_7 TaxID=1798369 RepID=A0A1F5YGR4_9BACT|nr:MAG: hypothetical protein A2Y99_04985 [Candidatus Gottesmanbacteria bacterium RBG_13_37_7]
MLLLVQNAIKSALNQNWAEAIAINKLILKDGKNDLEALIRLAYAYSKMGEINQAKKTYKKILQLDQYNHIALKNFDKLKSYSKNKIIQSKKLTSQNISPYIYLEEPGKTKIVSLIHVSPQSILSKLDTGSLVFLHPKKHTIEIRDQSNVYLGVLPDDLAFRLIRLIKSGNQYEAWIKNVEKNNIILFIKETKRCKRLSNQPSFITPIREYNATSTKIIKQTLENEDEKEESEDQEESEE